MTWSWGATALLAMLLLGCAGKSKSTNDDASSGGTSGTGTSTGGTSGTGANTGGTSGIGTDGCSAEGLTCEPPSRCVLDFFSEARVFPAGPAPSSFELGDPDGDTVLDAVIVQEDSSDVVTLLGQGDGMFTAPVASELVAPARDLALGDWDADARLDVVVPGPPARLSFGDGSGAFFGVSVLDSDGDPGAIRDAVTTGDLDENGTLDVVLLSYEGGTARAFLGNGRGGLVGGASFAVGPSAREGSLGDIDGDQRLDLVVINVDADTVGVLLGNGDGSFSEPTTFSVGGNPWAILMGDWNADRRLDVATANDFGGSVSLLLGNGDGTFSDARTFETGNYTGSLAAADFDRDGHLDLAVGRVNAGLDAVYVSVFPGDGSGDFAGPRAFRVGEFSELVLGSNSTGLASADLDDDGLIDLVVLNSTARELAVLLGTPFGRCVSE